MDETLIMSDELEDRLGYLRDDEVESASAECMANVLDLDTSFRILGWNSNQESWDTQSYSVTIELDQSKLRHFFDTADVLQVKIFEQRYAVTRTDAKLENGVWTARLYLDRMNEPEGDI
jgi:hypothetical protein